MKQHAIHIVRELRRHGFQAYLAGGCVRDMLLGLEPTDYDVTTDATPNEVMRIFPETYAVGAQFGVVLVPVPKGRRARDRSARASARNRGSDLPQRRNLLRRASS